MCSKANTTNRYTALRWDHQSPPLYATCTWRHSNNELWQLRPPPPPRFWKRYADDTCTILKRECSEEFTEHLNSIDPENIQWTSEGEGTNVIPTSNPGETETERILAFLDTETVIQGDNYIKTRVYRKKTHTNQYLNFNSNHPLDHKKSVVRTLLHRADKLISNEEDRQEEIKQVRTAPQLDGYPNWVLNSSTNQNHATEHAKQPTDSRSANSTSKTRSYAVQLPYVKGLTEPLCRLYKQYEVSSYVRPSNTLRQQLVHAKDPIPKTRVTGPVYHIPCSTCEADYVGKAERSLKATFDEHRRPSSSTSEVSRHIHTDCQGHTVHIEEAKLLTVEPKWFERGVKEAIYIRALHPSLNRDGGRYYLPPVYNNMITRHVNT